MITLVFRDFIKNNSFTFDDIREAIASHKKEFREPEFIIFSQVSFEKLLKLVKSYNLDAVMGAKVDGQMFLFGIPVLVLNHHIHEDYAVVVAVEARD